jgi:hypothetical protein
MTCYIPEEAGRRELESCRTRESIYLRRLGSPEDYTEESSQVKLRGRGPDPDILVPSMDQHIRLGDKIFKRGAAKIAQLPLK